MITRRRFLIAASLAPAICAAGNLMPIAIPRTLPVLDAMCRNLGYDTFRLALHGGCELPLLLTKGDTFTLQGDVTIGTYAEPCFIIENRVWLKHLAVEREVLTLDRINEYLARKQVKEASVLGARVYLRDEHRMHYVGS